MDSAKIQHIYHCYHPSERRRIVRQTEILFFLNHTMDRLSFGQKDLSLALCRNRIHHDTIDVENVMNLLDKVYYDVSRSP